MDEKTKKLVNSMTLGEIKELTDDAKVLIFLNPGIINALAENILKELEKAIMEGIK